MPRFYGPVGFDLGEKENPQEPGTWNSVGMVEKKYYGSILTHRRKWESGESINDNLNVQNRISIVADDYAYEHCSGIRYVRWMGACWKVLSFDVSRPRIILNLGGVWNGKQAGTSRGTCEPCEPCVLPATCNCENAISVP